MQFDLNSGPHVLEGATYSCLQGFLGGGGGLKIHFFLVTPGSELVFSVSYSVFLDYSILWMFSFSSVFSTSSKIK